VGRRIGPSGHREPGQVHELRQRPEGTAQALSGISGGPCEHVEETSRMRHRNVVESPLSLR
jgi:hypothetical protein